MRVIVSELSTYATKTGIGHYTSELLRCLREQAGRDEIDGFMLPWLKNGRFKSTLAPDIAPTAPLVGPSPQRTLAQRVRSKTIRMFTRIHPDVSSLWFRAQCQFRNYQLYHEPNFLPLPGHDNTVATIHDLSALLHPEWHPAARVNHFEREFQRGLRRCRHFFAISESARQEIIRFCNIPADKITRTYMGVRRDLQPMPRHQVASVLRKLGLPSQYLLCLGTVEPRKNIHLLMRAYCDLPRELRERYPLLLVGKWGWNVEDAANYYLNEARHRGVLHVGYLADEHVAAVYNGARAFLFPTFYEGFGLPTIEMMACGGAVIASTADTVRETVGDKAHMIDPNDQESWTKAMRRVIEDDDWWRSLREGATSVARRFTWDQCAADTLRVYRSLCGVSQPTPIRESIPAPERRAA